MVICFDSFGTKVETVFPEGCYTDALDYSKEYIEHLPDNSCVIMRIIHNTKEWRMNKNG